jgi:hypothetical protein
LVYYIDETITLDIRSVRSQIEKIEANMRAGVNAAEKRLGFSAVVRSMRLLTEAQSKLQDLEVLTNPMPPAGDIDKELYM